MSTYNHDIHPSITTDTLQVPSITYQPLLSVCLLTLTNFTRTLHESMISVHYTFYEDTAFAFIMSNYTNNFTENLIYFMMTITHMQQENMCHFQIEIQ